MEETKVIKYPLSTEKAIRLMEAENKLVFIVDNKARKAEIKTVIEEMFKVKLKKVNTMTGPDGRKKAYVTLMPEFRALDVATDLGLM